MSDTHGKTRQELVLMAQAEGVTDDYEFASWLVDEKEHFGALSIEDGGSDLESAWLEAQNWWQITAAEAESKEKSHG